MGKEVQRLQFTEADRRRFARALAEETERLRDWLGTGRFNQTEITAGYELEACLVGTDYRPADANTDFLERMAMPEVVPELARCDIEFNGNACRLSGDGLAQMHDEMARWVARGREVAGGLGLNLVLIGVLPTLEERHMELSHISHSARYRALNAAVAAQRGTDYVELGIRGREEYRGYFDSIMAESAATSHQLHLSLPPDRAARWYNAAVIASGPLLAVAANAPYLFGRDLWAETRIPVFAQAVDTGATHFVTFGEGYLRESLLELFEENRDRFPVLLPMRCEEGSFSHLSLHNGTIWRWNRPIVGTAGDTPHLRLEHRSLPGGPSVLDMVANTAFFFGLTVALGEQETPPETRLSFGAARANFYRAAREGMAARMHWFRHDRPARDLFEAELLPRARSGLAALDVEPRLAERYLQVIAARVETGLSGAGWQRAWVRRHGRDLPAMLAAYIRNQRSGAPVAEWPIE